MTRSKIIGSGVSGATIDSNGVVNIDKQDNAYELIKAYSSASNNTLSSASGSSTGGHINFQMFFKSIIYRINL